MTGQELIDSVVEIFDGVVLIEEEVVVVFCRHGHPKNECECCEYEAHMDANARYGVPGDEAMDWPIQFGPHH